MVVKAPARVVVIVALLLVLCQLSVWGEGDAAAGAPYNPVALMDRSSALCTGDRFTFAAFGDSYAREPLVSLLEMVDARAPSFVVTLGDMVEQGAKAEGLEQWRVLGERAGWFFCAHPTWPVIGNHEVDEDFNSGLSNFLGFYGLKSQDYSFTFRNSKFIVLGVDEEWLPSPPEKVEFVKRELADREKYDHVFVFRHLPFYTVGMKEPDQVPNAPTELTKLFEQAHVTATFAGHDHYYYRTRRNGVTHVIAGVSGAGAYNLKRLAEQAPGDGYMGVSQAEDQVMLHVPGRVDRSAPFEGYYETGDKLLFAVFVHVNGKSVTAEAVSMSGEVWDSFPLAGEGFGAIGAVAAPAASAE
jgi:hypothetical protein